ncbi:ATP phosphoribosyltransferase regulatory subunit [Candidatus Peregrinibacteria bacterium]|nr:ATP phosphoribosyltransferase regulatory subunit [Candidatus Peregrinibacteria bacterium]
MNENNIIVRNPHGVIDILPQTHEYFTYIKKVVRHRCRQAGFRRISPPMLEYKDVFQKTHGQHDDILNRLFTCTDGQQEAFSLKPESVSGIIRCFIEHEMNTWPQPVELFFIEPALFHPETQTHLKTKKNALSQYNEFGTVVLGEDDPALFAQLIQLAHKVLQDLGLEALYRLQINNLGCPECLPKFLADFQGFYCGKERALCERCKNFLADNPLRILECREEDCKILLELAPKLDPYLCKECTSYHGEFLEYLDEMALVYEKNIRLIPEMNFYNRTVFSYVNDSGERVCGGGRMDGIVENLGGPKNVPVFSFTMIIEKIINAMKQEKIHVPSKDDVHIFVAQLGKEAKKKCLTLMDQLREEGIKTVGALGKGSMREQIDIATKFNVPYMIIMGLTEVRENKAIIRNMKLGQQRIIPLSDVIFEVKKVIGEKKLDKYSPGEILY